MNKNIFRFAILSLFSTAALAASVPNTFTAGTTASAAEVNANFAALVTAVTALETKVAALESVNTPLTAADVAGTYQVLGIASTTGSLAATRNVASASEADEGTFTFNVNGTFAGVVSNKSNQFTAQGQNCVDSATSTDPATQSGGWHTHGYSVSFTTDPANPGGEPHAHGYSASLCSQSSASFTSLAVNDLNQAVSGTWALNAGTSTITVTPAVGSALMVYISKRGGVGFAVEVGDTNSAEAPGRRFGLNVLVKQ